MDLLDLTVTEARAAMLRGELTSTDYVQALLQRSEAASGLNAWVTQDTRALRHAAAQADASGATRDPSRALAGIPIALKDNIDTTALPTSGATPALTGRTPPVDAPVARALFDAGALLAGKANLHELAFGITSNNACTGAVRNPWDPSLIPGGSSGGSAVAVATRMVPAALGTDTGGSVRLPAALCGIVGLRPTVGRYPGAGIGPISHTRDTAGPLTRCVADAALLDGVLAGMTDPGAPLPRLAPRGLRLGVARAGFFGGLDPELGAVIEQTLKRLADAGFELVEADVPGLGPLNEKVGFPVALYELTQDLPAYLDAAGYGIGLPELAARIASPDVAGIVGSQLGAQAMPREAYEAALRARVHLQAAYAEYFARHHVDAMAFPTAILPARPVGDDETVALNGARVPTFATFIRNTDPGSNAGIPGISLPAGLSATGLPVGLELDGPAGSDRHLLAVAAAVESVLPPMPAPTGWQRRPASR